MNTFSERLQYALDVRKMKQSDLAKITDIGKSSISTYLTGSYEPKQKKIYQIAAALNVNEAWLLGYDVPMERENAAPLQDGGEQEISAIYHSLQKAGKKQLEVFARFLQESEQK